MHCALIWLVLKFLYFPPKDPDEDLQEAGDHLAALQTVAAEMDPVSIFAEYSLLTNDQVTPGKGSISLPASSYMEVPTPSNTGLVGSSSSSTYIEIPTTSSTSTSSGMPTTTSNHTNITSLHRY